jgi:hypothetical protein
VEGAAACATGAAINAVSIKRIRDGCFRDLRGIVRQFTAMWLTQCSGEVLFVTGGGRGGPMWSAKHFAT